MKIKKMVLIFVFLFFGAWMFHFAAFSQSLADKEDKAYYDNLRKACGGNSCCRASVNRMEKGGYKEARDGQCPLGFRCDGLECIGSFVWCEPEKKEEKSYPGVKPSH